MRKAWHRVRASCRVASFNGAATLGLRKVACTRWQARMLQCFNGAATLGLRKGPASASPTRRFSRFNGAATLGLRKDPRVNVPHRRAFSFNGAATLGLRKAPALYREGPAVHWLQWSRNFRVAERGAINVGYQDSAGLQWSRNFRVAERAPSPWLTPSGRPRFNGAATLGLRKAP